MRCRSSDISENQLLLSYGEEVFSYLLKDQTTQKNIYWATDSYAESHGGGYAFFDPITIEKVTGKNDRLVLPYALKSKNDRSQRIKEKAEVFTPSWICNVQNNLVDEAWFGRSEGLFNRPEPNNPQKWINNEEKIMFTGGKSWKDYVADIRLEITCGEAPYLTNRYDVVTGEYNNNVTYRIGILDRKLRIVSENAKDSNEWILWGEIALRSTYGFEWQGDNLLLARESLFFTFIEHYVSLFGEKKFNQLKNKVMPGVAYIISWNMWQMDGLRFGLPGYEPYVNDSKKSDDFYGFLFKEFEEEHEILPTERLCLIKDYYSKIDLKKENLSFRDFHDKNAPVLTFKSLVNKM